MGKQKLKQYVVEVIVKQEFCTLKDVKAFSKEEAFEKAKNITLSSLCLWKCGEPEIVSASIEDEY